MEHASELVHEAAGAVGQELVDRILANPQKDEADVYKRQGNRKLSRQSCCAECILILRRSNDNGEITSGPVLSGGVALVKEHHA